MMKINHKWVCGTAAFALGATLTAGVVAPSVPAFADETVPSVTSDAAVDASATVTVANADDLKAAVQGAMANTQTEINLSADIELADPLVISADKIIVLNLDGKTLSCGIGKDVIQNSGYLVVKNGTVKVPENGANTEGFAVNNAQGATLFVEQDEGCKTLLIGRAGINNLGVATVDDGSVESYNWNAIVNLAPGTLTINGGSVRAESGSSGYGRAVAATGEVVITGGSIYSGGESGAGDAFVNAISVIGKTASLVVKPGEGKTVDVTSETDYAVCASGGARVEIHGGSFSCNGARLDVMSLNGGLISIHGGQYKHELIEDYLADNTYYELIGDRYVVGSSAAPSAVEVSDYSQLCDALNGTLAAPKDITVRGDIVIPENDELALKMGYSLTVPSDSSLTVDGILRLKGALTNAGTLAVGDQGFIEKPLFIDNKGTISGFPSAQDGVCSVSTPMELQWLTCLVEWSNDAIPATIKLADNIDMPDDVIFTPIGYNSFFHQSTFDGCGHSINKLQVASDDHDAGLFGMVGDVVIKNLSINGTATTSTTSDIGALAGYMEAASGCTIQNVHIENYEVNSPICYGAAGFVGHIYAAQDAKIEFIGCTAENVSISGYANVGGFWGTSTGSLGTIGIYNSSLSGTVNALNVNGGICGGFGNSAKVEIIGLDRSGMTLTVKGSIEDLLVSATSTDANNQPYAGASNKATKNENGTWSVVADVAATVDGISYDNVEKAFAALVDGSSIKVEKEATLSGSNVIDKNVVFTGFGNVKLAEGASLTVSAGSYDSDPSGYLAEGYAAEQAGGRYEVYRAYRIALDANGGSLGDAAASSMNTGKGGTLGALPTPARSGYTFDGWFTEKDGGEKVGTETVFSADATIYAYWTSVPAGGGGGAVEPSDKTETVVNPDGSTTTTVTKPDGSSSATTTAKDGTEAVVQKDAEGNVTSTEVSVSDEAAASGRVELPVAEVEAATDSDDAQEIAVKVPASVTAESPVQVTVPVAKAGDGAPVGPGTVVVVVNPDGTETVLPKTAVSEGGVVVELEGSAVVKVVDNAKAMPDVAPDDWFAAEVVPFATARGIVNGVPQADGGLAFEGDVAADRATFVRMLHNLELNPEAAGEGSLPDVAPTDWYADAAAWALEANVLNGVEAPDGSKSFDGGAEVTREQMALFLMRYAQHLGLDTSARAELAFPDAADTSAWAEEAMSWAVAEGLFMGDGSTGELNPGDGATRAQVAAVMMRFINGMYA